MEREREREGVNGMIERHRLRVRGVGERESRHYCLAVLLLRGGSRETQVSAYSTYHTNKSEIQ